jgi:hypothetical protein
MGTYEELLMDIKKDLLSLFDKEKTMSTHKVYRRFFERFNYQKYKIIFMMMDRAAESLISDGILEISADNRFLIKKEQST